MFGIAGAKSARSVAIIKLEPTDSVISRHVQFFARSISFAPSACPTMIATALPMDKKTTLNRLLTVVAMLQAATTSSPRTE